MAQTIVERIISTHCKQPVYAGQIVIPTIDLAMATDGSGPLSIELFEQWKISNPNLPAGFNPAMF